MQHIPQPNEIYRHFKGNTYQIITIAEHSETKEILVIYQAMQGDYKTYARPIDMFLEKIDKKKYPKAVQDYRFEAVNKEEQDAAASYGAAWPERKEDFESPAEEQMPEAEQIPAAGQVPAEEQLLQTEQVPDIDPQVMKFLDADTYEERLDILIGLRHRITDEMINIMAIATDIEVKPGDIEERYGELKSCLLKLEKFECNRLR